MKKVILGLSVLLTSPCWAGPLGTTASQYVPQSKVVNEKGDEVKLQTPGGSIIEVEFDHAGSFEEASGTNLEKDAFVPPNGLITLKAALESVKKAGKTPAGKWSLENSTRSGWHYEFKGFENGKEMEYAIDAKTAKLTDSKIDN